MYEDFSGENSSSKCSYRYERKYIDIKKTMVSIKRIVYENIFCSYYINRCLEFVLFHLFCLIINRILSNVVNTI